MTRRELPIQAENIKRSVGSSATCSAVTVSELRLFLFPEPPSRITQSQPIKNDVQKRSATRVPKATTIRSEKALNAPKLEYTEAPVRQIKVQDRAALATEVVNITLRLLTEAARPSHAASKDPKTGLPIGVGSTPDASSAGPKEAHIPAPLQPRCVNMVPALQKKAPHIKSSPSLVHATDLSGISALAECGRLAFQALRGYQAQKALSRELSYLQLESGMSSLISKLIALELYDAAVKELCILQQRLALGPDHSKQDTNEVDTFANKRNLADLLEITCSDDNGPLLGLVVTTQLQVLRLLAARRDDLSVKSALEHLRLDKAHSPASVIQLQSVRADSLTKHKIAGQLKLLAQILMSMCPSHSSTQDDKVCGRERVSPINTVRLQLLALELKILSWEAIGFKCDFPKDILEPLSRFLNVFRRYTKLASDQSYPLVNFAVNALLLRAINVGYMASEIQAHSNGLRPVYSEMFELALFYNCNDEAFIWLQKWRGLCGSDQVSSCQNCKLSCSAASLQAQRFLSGAASERETVEAFANVKNQLKEDLHGDSKELDDLLLTITSLRKSTFAVAQHLQRSQNTAPIESSILLSHQCSKLCYAFVPFLNQYIGAEPRNDRNAQVKHRYLQRMGFASNVAGPFLDSVVSITRTLIRSCTEDWVQADAALQDCLNLASTVEATRPRQMKSSDVKDSKPNVFLAVSQIYWSRYKYLSQTNGKDGAILESLKASIRAARERPLIEKITASLPAKLELWASKLEQSREYGKALDAYSQALDLLIENGVLRRVADASSSQPLTTLLMKDGEPALVARMLLAYCRATFRSDPKQKTQKVILDYESLEDSERGLLLEVQLTSISTLLRSMKISAQMTSAIDYLARTLLQLYTEHCFPIRRLRIIDSLLWLHLSYPMALPSDIVKKSFESSTNNKLEQHFGNDRSLQCLKAHIDASRNVAIAVQEKFTLLKKERIEKSLVFWHELVIHFSKLEEIEARVGDIMGWLLRVDILAHHLDSQGLDWQRISTVYLSVRIREIFFPAQRSALVLSLVDLGRQHLNLGYTGRAGLDLHKATKLLKEAAVDDEATMKLCVAYAEFFLASGNIARCEENLTKAREVHEKISRGDCQFPTTLDGFILMSEVVSVYSLLAARQGHFSKALSLAKQSVTYGYKAWIKVESRQKEWKSKTNESQRDAIEYPIDDTSATAIFKKHNGGAETAVIRNFCFPDLWKIVPKLYQSLLQLSQLFAYGGLFSETRYYVEQAIKIATAVDSTSLTSTSFGCLADALAQSEDYIGACNFFKKSFEQVSVLQKDSRFALLNLKYASYHSAVGDQAAAEKASKVANSTLEDLMSPISQHRDLLHPSTVEDLEEKMQKLTVHKLVPTRSTKKQSQSSNRNTRDAASNSCLSGNSSVIGGQKQSDIRSYSSILSSIKIGVLRQRALQALRQRDLDSANKFLVEAMPHDTHTCDSILHTTLEAELLLGRGMEAMLADPVFCILPESTTSYPSVALTKSSSRTDHQAQTVQTNVAYLPKKVPVKASGKRTLKGQEKSVVSHSRYFQEARNEVLKVYQQAKVFSSTASLYKLTKLMAELLMMLSASDLSMSMDSSKASPVFYLYVTGTLQNLV